MKKIIFSLVVGCSSFITAYGQDVSVGPEIGLNLYSLTSMYNGVKDNNGLRPGLKLGGVVDIGITKHFSFQPGIFYSMKGSNERYSSSFTAPDGVTTIHDNSYDYRIGYIEIPLNFQYNCKNRGWGHLFFGAGPYIAFALGGSVTNNNSTTVIDANGFATTSGHTTTYELRVGNDAARDDIKTMDAGLNFDLGYMFTSGFFMRGNLGVGLANIQPGGDANNYMRNWGLGLSLGYMF